MHRYEEKNLSRLAQLSIGRVKGGQDFYPEKWGYNLFKRRSILKRQNVENRIKMFGLGQNNGNDLLYMAIQYSKQTICILALFNLPQFLVIVGRCRHRFKLN